MICPNCGAANDGRYCAKCGTLLDAPGTPTPSGTVVFQPPAHAVASPALEDNVAGALCYLGWIVTGILFLILTPYNKKAFVRFHAFQSVLLTVFWVAINVVLNIVLGPLNIGVAYSLIRSMISLCAFLVWLFCMYKAYNREMYQLPLIGPIAAKQTGETASAR